MRRLLTKSLQPLLDPPARDGVLGETRIFLLDAPANLPVGPSGRRIHHSTCLRWVLRGVRGVRLEAVRLGGRWVTSLEALDRFALRVTATSSAPTPPSPATDRRRRDKVAAELNKAGI
jgi:hypothetical protein